MTRETYRKRTECILSKAELWNPLQRPELTSLKSWSWKLHISFLEQNEYIKSTISGWPIPDWVVFGDWPLDPHWKWNIYCQISLSCTAIKKKIHLLHNIHTFKWYFKLGQYNQKNWRSLPCVCISLYKYYWCFRV